tara:strand:+ start:523 stop:867 length:345 start_codon:yes stop_codon:yes gene_type:complete
MAVYDLPPHSKPPPSSNPEENGIAHSITPSPAFIEAERDDPLTVTSTVSQAMIYSSVIMNNRSASDPSSNDATEKVAPSDKNVSPTDSPHPAGIFQFTLPPSLSFCDENMASPT